MGSDILTQIQVPGLAIAISVSADHLKLNLRNIFVAHSCLQYPSADSGRFDRALQAISDIYLSILYRMREYTVNLSRGPIFSSPIYARLLHFEKASSTLRTYLLSLPLHSSPVQVR
jgi:hypothetical protein